MFERLGYRQRLLIVLLGLLAVASIFWFAAGPGRHSGPAAAAGAEARTELSGGSRGSAPSTSSLRNTDTAPAGGGSQDGAFLHARELTYALEAESRTVLAKLADADGPADGGELWITLRGSMVMSLLERPEGEIHAAVRFPSLRVIPRIAGPSDGLQWARSLAEDLSRSTLVRMGSDGSTLGYRFPQEMLEENRNWVRTLVSAFRFVLPNDQSEEWSAWEVDATGEFEAYYHRSSRDPASGLITIEKRKLAYRSGEAGADHPLPAIERSHAEAVFSTRAGWIVEASHSEAIAMEIAHVGVAVRQTFDGTLRLIAAAAADPEALASITKRGDWSSAAGREEIVDSGRSIEADNWRR
jgi:hypothetical protein